MHERIRSFIRKEKLLLVIVALTAFFRIPNLFEPLWYGDEAIYLTIGQQILRGDVLYADIFDHKAPGIYYLTAAALALFGHSVAAIKIVLFGWSLSTLFVLYFLGRRLLDERAALLSVFFLSALVTPIWLEGDIFGSEILMILPTCIAIMLGIKGRPFTAGIFFGLSFLLKIPAIFDFGAFFVFTALSIDRGEERRTLAGLGRLLAGLLTPITITGVYFAAEGALRPYIEAALLFNLDYTGSGNHFLFEHGRLALNALPVVLVMSALAIQALGRYRAGEGRAPGVFEFLLLWLLFAFYGALLGGRPYEHYLIQAAPPFSLLLAFALTRAGLRRYAAGGVLVAAVIIAVNRDFDLDRRWYLEYYPNFIEYAVGDKSFDEYAGHLDGLTPGNYRLDSFLREHAGGSDATIYLFANQPAIYFRTRMDPVSKYIVYYHSNSDEERQRETALEVTQAQPLYVVVEDPPLANFPELERMIAQDYRLIRSEGILRVYVRK